MTASVDPTGLRLSLEANPSNYSDLERYEVEDLPGGRVRFSAPVTGANVEWLREHAARRVWVRDEAGDRYLGVYEEVHVDGESVVFTLTKA